jgi:NhaP-type Na+/H+ or K+/H+ antiporter
MLAVGIDPHTPPGSIGDVSHQLTRSLLGLFILGPILGALVGWMGITLLSQVRPRLGVRRDYESLYGLGLAFSGYAAAEAVGGSGFLAAFAAGLVINARDVELCDCFLEYGEATAEMLLLLTFVALGTSLIWKGLEVVSGPSLVFAAIALGVRSVVLYPVLRGTHLNPRERRLVALFGARGLSTLLLTLLPLFAGLERARDIFSIAALVVLLSVVLHGGAIALFLRANRVRERNEVAGTAPAAPSGAVAESPVTREESADAGVITVDELRALQRDGGDVVVLDARAPRSYAADPLDAVGAIRVDPEEPVRDATAQRLSKHGTLVVFCA